MAVAVLGGTYINYQNTHLTIDTKNGYISSLCYDGKEYIGGKVPIFVLSFRNQQGEQSIYSTYDMSLTSSKVAYAFSAGDMLTVVITENGEIDWHWGKKNKDRIPPDQEKAERFVKMINSWRIGKGKKYLHSGKMVKPMQVECGTYPIYRMVERDGPPNGVASVPEIHTCAWQASDGAKAQFLINYHEEAKLCCVEIDTDGYVLFDGETEIALSAGTQKITMKSLSAVMLEKN